MKHIKDFEGFLNESRQPFFSKSKFSPNKGGKISLKVEDKAPGYFTIELGSYDKNKTNLKDPYIVLGIEKMYIAFTIGDKAKKSEQKVFLNHNGSWTTPEGIKSNEHSLPNTDFFFGSFFRDEEREAIKTALGLNFTFWFEYLRGK